MCCSKDKPQAPRPAAERRSPWSSPCPALAGGFSSNLRQGRLLLFIMISSEHDECWRAHCCIAAVCDPECQHDGAPRTLCQTAAPRRDGRITQQAPPAPDTEVILCFNCSGSKHQALNVADTVWLEHPLSGQLLCMMSWTKTITAPTGPKAASTSPTHAGSQQDFFVPVLAALLLGHDIFSPYLPRATLSCSVVRSPRGL